jgi:hypothetical protein
LASLQTAITVVTGFGGALLTAFKGYDAAAREEFHRVNQLEYADLARDINARLDAGRPIEGTEVAPFNDRIGTIESRAFRSAAKPTAASGSDEQAEDPNA